MENTKLNRAIEIIIDEVLSNGNFETGSFEIASKDDKKKVKLVCQLVEINQDEAEKETNK